MKRKKRRRKKKESESEFEKKFTFFVRLQCRRRFFSSAEVEGERAVS